MSSKPKKMEPKVAKGRARVGADVDGFDLPKPHKRTEPDPGAVDRFVAAAAASSVVSVSSTGSSVAPKSTGRLRRAEAGERVTLYLPSDLVTEVRKLCAEQRRSLSDAGTDAFRSWLAGMAK